MTMQNTNSAGNTSYYFQNNRGSFASYGGLLHGGSTYSSTLFGVASADRTILLSDGASSAGMIVGTLTATPLMLGTNGAVVTTFGSDGTVLIGSGTASGQLTVYSQNTARAGLILSALTGTAASQQVLQSYNANGATLTYSVRADGFQYQSGVTFANLPGTPSNGMYGFCSDCAVTSGADNTCTSGGNGALAVRLNGVWRCFIAQN
jgi:hypothetical protein